MTDHSPSPTLDAPLPPQAAAPSVAGNRRLKWIGGLALGAVVLAAIAISVSEKEVTASLTSDVPRVEEGRIVFSKTFAERIGLTSQVVKEAPLAPVVSAVGMVTFDPRYVARVGTRLRGLIRDVRHYEGEKVDKGTVLAEIDSPELGEAQAQVTMLSAQTETAHRDANRERSLVERNLSTIREAEEAATEERSYQSMLHAATQKVKALAGGNVDARALGVHYLISPLAGTIVERHVTKGELVDGDHVAFLIADLTHLWVELDVFERSLEAIRVGDQVVVRSLSRASHPIQGRVAQVGAIIDPATRSAAVRIEVDNQEGHLRPGQAVDAKIQAAHADLLKTTLVPAAAVTFVDGNPTVFVLDGDSAVKPTQVTLGDSNGELKQVMKGIQAGDRVVVRGVFELKSELFR